jgi:RimJ/RimL family protein N-acetyltransferase
VGEEIPPFSFMVPRKLGFLDRIQVELHFLSLSQEDRRLRFGITASDDYIKKYIARSINDPQSMWFGIEEDGYLVAICHAAVDDKQGELGCSVLDHYRGEGYAQALFDRAITWLRSRGITHIFMHCLSENGAMKHIALKNRMHVITQMGETDADIHVEPPTPITHVMDAYYDRIGIYDMILKSSRRMMSGVFMT